MNHSFDVDVANRHGVDAAIMIENMRFWIAKNKANGRHFYDGRWWTYNSVRAFTELFPYWSAKQVRTILDRLVSRGVLVAGNYNASKLDKTKWYAFEGPEHQQKQADASAQTGKSTFAQTGKSLTSTDINQIPTGFALFWSIWPKSTRKGGKSKCLSVWLKGELESAAEQITSHVRFMARSADWKKDNGAFVPAPLVYLNQRRWDGADLGELHAGQDRWGGAL